MARDAIPLEEMAQTLGRGVDSVRQLPMRRHGGWAHLARTAVPMVRPVAQYRAPDGPALAEVFAPAASASDSCVIRRARRAA